MTATLLIPDLSEFQSSVNFATLATSHPAVILRAHNGNRADHTFAARVVEARKHMSVRLFYGYMVANRDAATQARELAAIVGPLQPGEAFVCDAEVGSGDQSARVLAYLGALGGRDIAYSGDSFYHDHLQGTKGKGILFWDAAYRNTEPTTQHFLWQHSDHDTFPGVSSACDGSIFHGSIQDLKNLINPPAPAKPAPKPAAKPAAKPAPKPVSHPDPPHPSWWTYVTKVGEKSQEVASALKVLGNKDYPQQVTLDARVAGLFKFIQHHIGEPQTGDLTARTAQAIQEWPKK
jgi:hypothetical protein